MRVIGISCVRNEEDIIEAFVRHTLVYCQTLILIENGSTDATPRILQQLKDEGLALHVIPDATIGNIHVDQMNRLLQLAARDFSADWIVCLDTDEFIAVQPGITNFLPEPCADDFTCLKFPLRSYYTSPGDSRDILNPVERITNRLIQEPRESEDGNFYLYKVVVPGRLALLTQTYVGQGNHVFFINGEMAPSRILENASLAHFSLRSARQYAMKVVTRHLQKFLSLSAKGDESPFYENAYAEVSKSFTSFIQHFHRQPIPFLPPHDPTAVVSDPIACLGGPLRYTPPQANDTDLFVHQLLDFAEILALAAIKPSTVETRDETAPPPKLRFEVFNDPAHKSGIVHIVEPSPSIKHALHCPLNFELEGDEIRLHFHSEPGLIEIGEITLINPAGPEMERTFGPAELNAMLRVVSNAAAIDCKHIYRLLVSREPVTVIFRGWKREGQDVPSAFHIKFRYENRLLPGVILGDSVLNAITQNVKDLERYRPDVSTNSLLDCIDFPINFSAYGNARYFAVEGWGEPDPWGMWTVGEKSTLRLSFRETQSRALNLIAYLRPFCIRPDKKLKVRVFMDDTLLATWIMGSPDFKKFSARIPGGKIKPGQCAIRFEIDSPVSPAELDASASDTRKLGVGFRSVNIQRALF